MSKKYTEEELVNLRDRNEAWLKSKGVQGTSVSLVGGELRLRVYTTGAAAATRREIKNKLGDAVYIDEGAEIVAD